jgi:hypothetical protein
MQWTVVCHASKQHRAYYVVCMKSPSEAPTNGWCLLEQGAPYVVDHTTLPPFEVHE